MPADNPYQSGQAVTRAIHDAARTRASATGENVGDLTRQAYFDRFLCRVFADDDERFALKGGMGMLARFPRSRHTRDIDLERADSTIETAVADLRIRAEADLGDHFRFAYVTHTEAIKSLSRSISRRGAWGAAASTSPSTLALRLTLRSRIPARGSICLASRRRRM